MIKIKHKSILYYIPSGVFFDMDRSGDFLETNLSQNSVMIVDTSTNKIIKCRYQYSELMNSHMEKLNNESRKASTQE